MGLSIDHSVAIKFANEDDAERFYNYVDRALTDNHLNRTTGADVDAYKKADDVFNDDPTDRQNTSWALSEVFECDGENSRIEHDLDGETVTLQSGGYGNIPAFLVYSSITQYNSEEIFWKSFECQCGEGMDWFVYWNHHRCDATELPQFAKHAF